MRARYSRWAQRELCPMLFVSACCVTISVMLSSCSANLLVQLGAPQTDESVGAVPYSIVCVIHGDGDYLYHDISGNEHTADEEALAAAKRIAQQNPYAEVFIFHQRPRKHFLFLFARHDGEYYWYRNGRLIANELYWRDQGASHFETEVELYRRSRSYNQRAMMSVFVYCGHEIPEVGGPGYDASDPDRAFTVHDFARGIKGFTPDSSRFDLMVLSTCFGGTPYTIGALGSLARYIIASPENLHLSYFDLRSLEGLDLSLWDNDVPAFAQRFAQQAFDQLTRNVQTAVSVGVYDVDRVQKFVHSVHGEYESTLTNVTGVTGASMASIEHCDCADAPAYVRPTMGEGVEVFYRPARFGRSKYKLNHSGWECWKERGPQSNGATQ